MKPKFTELENSVTIQGTKNSTFKNITICLGDHEWDHNAKPGCVKVLYSFVDGKYCSVLDYDKFRNQVEYTTDEICIRSGSSGTAVVLVSDLTNAIEKLNKNNPSDTEVQTRRILKGIDNAVLRGNNLRDKLDKKKDAVDIKVFIRNLKDVKIIEKALHDSFDSKRAEYVKSYTNHFSRKVDSYEKELLAGGDKGITSIMWKSSSMYGREKTEFAQTFFDETPIGNKYSRTYTITRKENWKELCIDAAESQVALLEETFMNKNIFKIGTIVHNKDNFKFVRVLHIRTDVFGFEGEFLIGFKDGSSFVVRSQAVYAEGPIVVGHYRYPTTFHVIQYPDGKLVQKHSEEEMINEFSKNKQHA